MTSAETETRLQNLEIALSEREKDLSDLSEMVEKQWKEIDRLRLRLDAALNKIADLEQAPANPSQGSGAMSSADEAAAAKPPHY
jgi:uncharacterized coiled-coil protein SlyX